MRRLPLKVDEASARKRIETYRFRLTHLVMCVLQWRPGTSFSDKRLPYLELVWMPYYVVPVQVKSPRGPGEVLVSVEGRSGGIAIFERQDDVEESEPETGEVYGPRLSTDEVAQKARQGLQTIALRRRGQKKPLVTGNTTPYLVYFPLWIYYYARRRDCIDIKVIDGATGDVAGNRLRVAVLDAFVEQDRRQSDQPEIS